MLKLFTPEKTTDFEKSLAGADPGKTLLIYDTHKDGISLLLDCIISDVMDKSYFGLDDYSWDEDTLKYTAAKNRFEMFKAMGVYDDLYKKIEEDEIALENFEKAFQEQGGLIKWSFNEDGTTTKYYEKEDEQ
ncbi:MAG TPA: hypothetical protein VJ455_01495 [Ignavibacteria bacterium]|nr:hypothetical protein [Ignavibacteria bacterium]